MQRKTAVPVDTRAEIVGAARRLFTTAGYEATSVQAIIDAARVSKGTFYHYFQSKEQALDAVVEQLAHEWFQAVDPIVNDDSLSAVEKMNRFMSTLRRMRLQNLGFVLETSRVLMRDENAIIRQKITRRNAAIAAPLFTEIIRQGVGEGVFTTPDPAESAQLILDISTSVGERTFRCLLDQNPNPGRLNELIHRMNFVLDAMERILGAPRGSLERVPAFVIDQIKRALENRGRQA